jgi:glycosyltransferase involved in cell wall biosynthesis
MNLFVACIVLNDFRNDTRVEKTCRSLVAGGYGVTIFAFGGEGLPVYEERDGLRIYRSGGFGRIERLIRLSFRFLSSAYKFDFIHCNDLEPLPLCVLAKLLKFGKTKLFYDAHELETEKLAARGWRQPLSRFLERALISSADAVITVSDRIASWYAERYDCEFPQVIINSPVKWRTKKADLFRDSFAIPSSTQIFLYLGSIQQGRAIEPMLEAFIGADGIALVFMGYGGTSSEGKRLDALVRQTADLHPNIFFHEPVGQSELPNYVSSADVGLCLIEDVCLSYRYCLPNKLFESAMGGLPVIVSDLPELRRLVFQYDCGVVCRDLSPVGIHASIEELQGKDLSKVRANSRKMAEDHCWEQQEKKLVDLYRRLIPKARLDT